MDNILKEYRDEIKEIDEEILSLLDERFDICWEIGGYKKEHGLPVLDEVQEQKKLAGIEKDSSEENAPHILEVFRKIFEESRNIQENM